MNFIYALVMLAVILFVIGFLNKLGTQKEYILRGSMLLFAFMACPLLGTKLAVMFSIPPLSEELIRVCKLLFPYSGFLVIFVLGAKVLKGIEYTSHHTKKGVHW